MCEAGNQPRRRLKTRMKSPANQNDGMPYRPRLKMEVIRSTHPYGRRAAATASTSPSTRSKIRAAPASRRVGGSARARTVDTGCLYMNEMPRSPVATAPSQLRYCSRGGRSRP